MTRVFSEAAAGSAIVTLLLSLTSVNGYSEISFVISTRYHQWKARSWAIHPLKTKTFHIFQYLR